MTEKVNGKFMSTPCQVTYEQLSKPDEKGQFRMTVRCRKDGTYKGKKFNLGVYSDAYKECLQENFPSGTKLAKSELPLKDGDDSGKPHLEDHFYMNLKTSYPVACLDANKQPINPAQINRGDTVVFMFSPYNWEYNGRKGISFGLGNIILLEEADEEAKKELGGGGATDPLSDFQGFDTSAFAGTNGGNESAVEEQPAAASYPEDDDNPLGL